MSRKRAISPSLDDFDDDFSDHSNGSKGQSLPVQRNAANARERARMRVLSSAFCRLKTKLPWVPADTKLSKLDTLRLATIYIQQLRSSLATGKELYHSPTEISRFDTNSSIGQNQTSLVWPFTFQQQQHHQQTAIEPLESTQLNPSQQNPAAWYERDLIPTDHYNVNFYSTTSSPTNYTYSHERALHKSAISNTLGTNNA